MATIESKITAAGKTGATRDSINLWKLGIILIQLMLALLVIRQFQIESAAFLRVFIIACVGFVIHYFTPLRFRIHVFAGLSLVAILVVMGLVNGLWLLAFGLALLGACHLPLAFYQRILIICALGGGFAWLRVTPMEFPWSSAIWPILGSMFMFRLIVYLYDLKHGKAPTGLAHRLAYFFMLPNVCFPLFPVIDSNDFRRRYFDEERHHIYQTGVDWIARGLIHLLLYRYIYYHLTVAPEEIQTVGDLGQFLVTNFLLYLKVSGLFHLIIGILHLYGFTLPETHRLYYLSSSFTDFWRRINIYWKDFMMKVFYYPVYFRLRRRGDFFALVVSTMLVFMLTWILHSYQWFWIRGSFPITWQDGAFWGLLAVVVVLNSIWEIKKGRPRQLEIPAWYAPATLAKSLRILIVFWVICTLWSLWNAESLTEWLAIWRVFDSEHLTATHVLFLVATLVVLIPAIAILSTALARFRRAREDGIGPQQGMTFQRGYTFASLALVAAIGLPQVYSNLNTETANFVLSIRSAKLSKTDTAKLEKGYYEDLVRVDRFNSPLWEIYAKRPTKWLDPKTSGLKRLRDDFLRDELMPSARSVTSFSTITTNRWGMRDKDYALEPPAGSYRIALLGASSVMGWGVEDNETFDALLEESLNRDSEKFGVGKFEVLNFGVAGYFPPQQLMVLEQVEKFSPDAVFYMATGRELQRSIYFLQQALREKIEIPYPFLTELAAKAGVTAETSEQEALQRLTPYKQELLEWLYAALVENSRQNNVVPVWAFLPQVNKGRWLETVPETEAIARDAGFEIINMVDVYDQDPVEKVRLAEWDYHPGAFGHLLVAKRLEKEIDRQWQGWKSNRRLADRAPGARD